MYLTLLHIGVCLQLQSIMILSRLKYLETFKGLDKYKVKMYLATTTSNIKIMICQKIII